MHIRVRIITFPGSDQEHLDLVAAVRRHCACRSEDTGVVPDPCPPHDLLRLDSTLKHLVFYRRWHRRQREERGLGAVEW
jgi:hypothetical protein